MVQEAIQDRSGCSVRQGSAVFSFYAEFRASKDLDIVPCVEALNVAFVTAFWTFVDRGGYVSFGFFSMTAASGPETGVKRRDL